MNYLNRFNRKREVICLLWGWLLVMMPAFVTAAEESETLAVSEPGEILPLETRALLAPWRETTLSSLITGRIERVTVDEGERFREGQILVAMNCAIQKIRLEKAQAEHDASEYALHVQQYLVTKKASSTLKTKLAEANLAKAGAELKELGEIVRMCVIRAPFNGRVVKRSIHPYQSVTEGTPLLEILDDSAFEARLVIPSRWLGWLRMGQAFTIRIDENGRAYQASVSHLGARINAASQTLRIRGRIEGVHPELIAGMSGAARFQMPPP